MRIKMKFFIGFCFMFVSVCCIQISRWGDRDALYVSCKFVNVVVPSNESLEKVLLFPEVWRKQ